MKAPNLTLVKRHELDLMEVLACPKKFARYMALKALQALFLGGMVLLLRHTLLEQVGAVVATYSAIRDFLKL